MWHGVLVATEGAPREENLLPTTLSVWKFRTWGFNNLLWARSRTSLSALNFIPSQAGLFVTNLFTSGPVSSSESSLSSELVYSMLRNNQSLCWNTTRKNWYVEDENRTNMASPLKLGEKHFFLEAHHARYFSPIRDEEASRGTHLFTTVNSNGFS
ncbi:hypothetical protein pdam_00007377 [Pocillopora damicornis]|uniref:Uncharacterized protein n=1 Tax=Pocillopora damicornis TaxID=46731 RepID=A0A3M6V5N8_POCDA|nr:hypothetical protein pdam_00007377 [Pocillopora damicornis]